MNKFYIFFGYLSSLSLLEFKYLFSGKFKQITPNIVEIESTKEQVLSICNLSGGITKAACLASKFEGVESLKSLISESDLKNVAVTDYANNNITSSDLKNIKSDLKNKKSIRFIDFKTDSHSLIVLRKQHVLELNLLSDNIIAETIWIQNSDEWTNRDRRRPYQDIKRGMLPPKIARIMVNLASRGESITIADPFCGTGTISQEAMMVGCDVFASDISIDAVQGTRENLSWIKSKYNLESNFSAEVFDATNLDKKTDNVDAIVTEPYMGPLISDRNNKIFIGSTIFTEEKIKNIIKGLNKLYLGAIKSWHNVLTDNGIVVMIFPEFHIKDKIYKLPLVDTCEKHMYNKVAHEDYGKEKSLVRRQIIILEKSNGTYKANG